MDAEDGDISGSVSVSGQVVNLSVPGSYLIEYDVADSTGNDAETVTRTVLVQDTLPPIITLTGDAVVNLTVDPGGTYSDAGATALDTLDGDLTSSIAVSGDVVALAGFASSRSCLFGVFACCVFALAAGAVPLLSRVVFSRSRLLRGVWFRARLAGVARRVRFRCF